MKVLRVLCPNLTDAIRLWTQDLWNELVSPEEYRLSQEPNEPESRMIQRPVHRLGQVISVCELLDRPLMVNSLMC